MLKTITVTMYEADDGARFQDRTKKRRSRT